MRRAVLLAVAASLVAAAPASANFDSCQQSGTTMTATFTNGTSGTLSRSGSNLLADGAQCDGTATVNNVDTIVVNGVDDHVEQVVLDLSGGLFLPGATDEPGTSDEIEIELHLGPTSVPYETPALLILGGNGGESIVAGHDPALGPMVNLNPYEPDDGGLDADLTFGPSLVTIDIRGNGGADYLSTQGGYGTGGFTLKPSRAYILGGPGADVLSADGQDVRPGPGDDEIYSNGGFYNLVDYVNAAGPVTIDLAIDRGVHTLGGTTVGGDGDGGTDTYHDVTGIYGSPFGDTIKARPDFGSFIYGAGGGDTLLGNTGTDELHGGPGEDTIDGGDDGDVLAGDEGDDDVSGGEGSDTIHEVEQVYPPGPNGADDLHGGDGFDEVVYVGLSGGVSRTAPVHVSLDGVADDGESGEHDNVFADVESVRGGDGNDTIIGSSAANILSGGVGADTIRGGDGDDLLEGESGNDDLDGEGGFDYLVGGNGDDRLEARDGLRDKIDCGPGIDTALVEPVDEIVDVAACDFPAPPAEQPPVQQPPVQQPPVVTPPAVTPPPPSPTVASLLSLPATKRCVSRRKFTVRVRREIRGTVKRVTIFFNGRKVKSVTGRRIALPIDLRGLPKGKVRVKLVVALKDGRKATDTRTYHTCATKKRKGKFDRKKKRG